MTVDQGAFETSLPVQKQLDAYNARDIDAFMQCWADDCRYYAFPSQLLADGANAVRERHVARFQEANLFGRLTDRMVVGNIVVDREVVTRTFPQGPGEIDVIAIYEVENGKIANAWFKMGTPRLHVAEGIAIRRANPGDAGIVGSLTRAAYAKWIPIIGREPMPMKADYDEAVRKHRIDLLYLTGDPVGLIELIPEADCILIENVAVSPAFQGQGFGRTLLAHAEQVAASLGHSAIRLYTNRLFAENIALYRKLGYAIDREEPFMGGFTVYMSKRL